MKYNFDQIINRRGTRSVKWDLYTENELPMWVADMDFLSPQPMIDALQKRVAEGVFGYTLDSKECKQVVVDWVKRRHQWDIELSDIIFVPGVVVGFNLGVVTLTEPTQNLTFQTPAYGPFYPVADNHGLNQLRNSLVMDADGQYEIDFVDFEEKISSGPGVFLLCNPHNPTGRVFTEEELLKMGEICVRYGVPIISDEIHSDMIHAGSKHIPIANLSKEIADSTITLIAPSKTFNVAGLDGSIAIITNPELREKFLASRKGLVGSVNLLAKTAMCACYTEGEEWLTQLLAYLEENMQVLEEFFRKEIPEVNFARPQGTFLAWVDMRALNLGENPSKTIKEKTGVIVNDGAWFGEEGKGFVRLNFGCPRSMLMEGLEKIKKAVKS